MASPASLLRCFAIAICFLYVTAALSSTPDITLKDWSSLPPSPTLTWTPCFENFTCSRLEVPLDYGDPSRGNTAIAFIKFAATNVSDGTRDLLLNPGGPGTSGIDLVLTQDPALTALAQGQHNIVGFDPRGVGRSGPEVNCWPAHPQQRAQFERLYYPDTTNASATSLGQQFAAAEIFGRACSATVGGKDGTASFVSTPAVARDLLSYIEAEAAASGRKKLKAKLWYYGISYGTVIGTTFAHLFPDRVGRMILDAVVDAEDYYGLGWESNLLDTDEVLAAFFESCFEAGQEICPFWAPSVQRTAARLDNLLERLRYNPIPILPGDACPLPMLATYSDLKQVVLRSMYFPFQGFPSLATILAGLEQGDTTAYTAAVMSGTLVASPCNHAIEGLNSTATKDVNTIISCVDNFGENKYTTIEEYEEFVDTLTDQSAFFGEVWPTNGNPVLCRAFEGEAVPSARLERPSSILERRKTKNPILFVTSAFDPVTPHRGAHKMSAVFPGSVVLTQNSVGHTALLSASSCLFENIHGYLLEGRLPAANATCEPDVRPFESSRKDSTSALEARSVTLLRRR
ncbi:Alpha/Beta hydrolase protein [Aspergillus karnatakaensis]|uniref:Alpha/Beta hydrolase protein n=1 Tax=Aspergillus karnatakaensis TaxID=1810916 RepID=UPI003CCCBA7B